MPTLDTLMNSSNWTDVPANMSFYNYTEEIKKESNGSRKRRSIDRSFLSLLVAGGRRFHAVWQRQWQLEMSGWIRLLERSRHQVRRSLSQNERFLTDVCR